MSSADGSGEVRLGNGRAVVGAGLALRHRARLLDMVLVLYEPLMVSRWGATLGKLAVGIRVVRFADGSRASRRQSWARVALPSAAGALTFGVGWFVAWFVLAWPMESGRDWRGWHDRLAGTVVVRTAETA